MFTKNIAAPNTTKIFASLVGLVLALLMTGIIPASATTTVSISPSTQIVSQGQSFTINVSIEPETAIAGAQFNLQFNSSIVNVNGVMEGELFKQNDSNTLFNPGTVDNVAGVVTHVWGIILNTSGAPKNVSTAGTFAIVNITASNTAAGTSLLALIGIPPISVLVSDPEGNAVPISVLNGTVKVNRAPELDSIGDKSVNDGQTLTFTITATDPDADSLTYSASNLPNGANFDPYSRTFSWTPNHEQAETYPNVHFAVTDGHLTDSEDITITVNNLIVKPPVVTSPNADPQVIPEDTDNEPLWGELSKLSVVVTDDSEIVSVTINLSSIGGSAVQEMTPTSGNVWYYETNASIDSAIFVSADGSYVPHLLRVNATDVHGYSNTSVNIELMVMKNGDVDVDGDVTYSDAMYLYKWKAENPGFDTIYETVADVDGDGSVTYSDAMYLYKWKAENPGFDVLH